MKRCPKCEADYTDNSLVFCLQDRAPLIPAPTPKQAADTLITPPTIRSKSRLLLLILLVAISLAAFLVIYKSQITSPHPQDRPYELKKYNEIPWDQLISGANRQVIATGIFLTKFDPPQVEQLIKKIKRDEKFQVKIFVLKPNGSAVKERSRNEYPPPIPSDIAGKLLTFRELLRGLSDSEKDRLTVKYYDVCPSIAVIIIDDDLYTYPYVAGRRATDSTVTVLRKYESNPQIKDLAPYFKSHLDYIETKAKKPAKEDYDEYEKMVSP